MDIRARLNGIGLIPVVMLERPDDGPPVADALVAGGIACIEVTFRTDAALGAIERIRRQKPDLLIAAGTVLTPADADAAVSAGADLIVAPGFNPQVVDHCIERQIAVMPGIATPSELEQALSRGLDVVKVFPAEPLGGISFMRALAGPYPRMGLAPTGGIAPDHLAAYLALANVVAVGGSWLVRPAAIAAGDFAVIERLAREAMAIVHVGRAHAIAGGAAR